MKQDNFKQKCIELQLKYDIASKDAKDFEDALGNVRRSKEYWQQESKKYKEALMNILYWDCDICKEFMSTQEKWKWPCYSEDKLAGFASCTELINLYIKTILNS